MQILIFILTGVTLRGIIVTHAVTMHIIQLSYMNNETLCILAKFLKTYSYFKRQIEKYVMTQMPINSSIHLLP